MDLEHSHQFFIGSYDDCLTKDECDVLINFFEDRDRKHEGLNQFEEYRHLGRHDLQINLLIFENDEKIKSIVTKLLQSVEKCVEIYKSVFFTYNQILHEDVSQQLVNPSVKIQKTPIRGGYHVWHCEITDVSSLERSLAWILYLNDIPEGEGETEFLWQGVRIQPKVGRCVLWPAQFTHVHRGNPVYTKEKYIATGWICYKDVIENHAHSPFIYDPQVDMTWKKTTGNRLMREGYRRRTQND